MRAEVSFLGEMNEFGEQKAPRAKPQNESEIFIDRSQFFIGHAWFWAHDYFN